MKQTSNILACFLLMMTVSRCMSTITEAQKKELLDLHNALRRNISLHGDPKFNQPGAADMTFLEWDEDEAAQAQKWADTCTVGHDRNSQNWAGGNIEAGPLAMYWYNEAKWYGYEDQSCTEGEVCGHYTMMMWADSYYVGCGIANCASNEKNKYSTSMVCNYKPTGNYAGVRPYMKGATCAFCPDHRPMCQNGLCVREELCANGDCECKVQCQNGGTRLKDKCGCQCKNGYHGNACELECKNKYDWCTSPGVRDMCEQHYRDYCEISCGKCTYGCDKTADSCQNGGKLIDLSCTCECPSTHTGEFCEQCIEIPCKSGGTFDKTSCRCINCHNGFDGRDCGNKCTDDYNWCNETGAIAKCESDYKHACKIACGTCVHSCNKKHACKNGGTFDERICGCRCPSHANGHACDNCLLTPGSCKNGGQVNSASCECECAEGYTGKHCEAQCKNDYEFCEDETFVEYCADYGHYCHKTCNLC